MPFAKAAWPALMPLFMPPPEPAPVPDVDDQAAEPLVDLDAIAAEVSRRARAAGFLR